MITMRKLIHESPLLSFMGIGLRLPELRSAKTLQRQMVPIRVRLKQLSVE